MEIIILVMLIIAVVLLGIIIFIQLFVNFFKDESIIPDDISSSVTENLSVKLNESEIRMSEQFKGVITGIAVVQENAKFLGTIGNELKEILSGKSSRGQYGEVTFETILNDVLPRECWESQYQMGSKRCDYIVKTKEFIIPIDCKFPLSNYQKMLKEDHPDIKEKHYKKLIGDIKKRIEETSKYIDPEKKTSHHALMYVPAESIYQVIMNETDLLTFSRSKNVLVCSPSTLHYILHAINETIKREKLPEKLEGLLNDLKALSIDITKFHKEFGTLGGHLNKAMNKFNETQARIASIKGKSENLTNLEIQE